MPNDPAGLTLRAFADESFEEAQTAGFYVLAAGIFPDERHDEVRAAMRLLRGKRAIKKLHWSEMDALERQQVTERLAEVGGRYVVAVGSPVRERRQERARAFCLRRLVYELYMRGIGEMLLEARTRVLDQRDVVTMQSARYDLPKGTVFRVEHMSGADEPLFWAADIIAGAVRANEFGDSRYFDIIRGAVQRVDVDVRC